MTDEASASAAEIRDEIDRTRDDLAHTVDALHDKLDVKARAKTKAHDVSATVSTTAAKLKQQAPPPVQSALDRGASAFAPTAARAEPYRSQIALGAGAVFILLLILRRLRRSR
jgi:ABC-type transporter Mla subunit MlaD